MRVSFCYLVIGGMVAGFAILGGRIGRGLNTGELCWYVWVSLFLEGVICQRERCQLKVKKAKPRVEVIYQVVNFVRSSEQLNAKLLHRKKA